MHKDYKEYYEFLVDASDYEGEVTSVVEIRQMLAGKNVLGKPLTSIDDFLSAMPKGQRKYFTAAFKSGSAQHASGDKPRIVLFGPSGKLLLAFTSDPAVKGGDKLEIIELPSGESPRFFEISQTNDGKSSKLSLSEQNPTNCTTCHGNPPRPIFDNYPLWPVFFGANDDQIRKSSSEDKNFQAFLKASTSHPRYKHLQGMERVDFAKSKGDIIGENEFKNPDLYALPSFPNALLSLNLAKHSVCEMYHFINDRPTARKYVPLLIATTALRCEGEITEYIPEGDRETFQKQYAAFLKEITENAKSENAAQKKETSELSGVDISTLRNIEKDSSASASSSRAGTALLRFIIETKGNGDLSGWVPTRNRKTYSMITPSEGLPKDLARAFLAEFSKSNPEFAKAAYAEQCKQLKDLSLSQLSLSSNGNGTKTGSESKPGHR